MSGNLWVVLDRFDHLDIFLIKLQNIRYLLVWLWRKSFQNGSQYAAARETLIWWNLMKTTKFAASDGWERKLYIAWMMPVFIFNQSFKPLNLQLHLRTWNSKDELFKNIKSILFQKYLKVWKVFLAHCFNSVWWYYSLRIIYYHPINPYKLFSSVLQL